MWLAIQFHRQAVGGTTQPGNRAGRGPDDGPGPGCAGGDTAFSTGGGSGGTCPLTGCRTRSDNHSETARRGTGQSACENACFIARRNDTGAQGGCAGARGLGLTATRCACNGSSDLTATLRACSDLRDG
jgi:hypothetical protein